MSKSNNEKIGYRNPPQSTQFKKGHSGNPKGRPKGKRNLATVLEKMLHEKVIINENGRRKTVTKLEAAMKQLANKAASGDRHAVKQLIELDRSIGERSLEASTPTTVMAEVDQKVLQNIFSRFEKSADGGNDDDPDDK